MSSARVQIPPKGSSRSPIGGRGPRGMERVVRKKAEIIKTGASLTSSLLDFRISPRGETPSDEIVSGGWIQPSLRMEPSASSILCPFFVSSIRNPEAPTSTAFPFTIPRLVSTLTSLPRVEQTSL